MNTSVTKSFFICYFLMLSHQFFRRSYFFFQESFPTLDYTLFAYPLTFITINPTIFLPIFYIVSMFTILISLLFYHKKTTHIVSTMIYLLIMSLVYSTGKINHSEHGWLIISIGVCFLNIDKKLTSTKNLFTIRILQGLLLSNYAISGVWKLRSIITNNNFDMGAIALNHISVGIAEGSQKGNFIFDLLIENPTLIQVGFTAVLFFQLSCLFPIITQRYYKIWAILCCLFHFSTEITLGINFIDTRTAILFILLFTEFLIQIEKNSSLKTGKTNGL